MTSPPDDVRWLDAAVRLARSRLGATGPFPATAALIVDATGRFLEGRGVTGPMGRPSAVLTALADARGRMENCTAYLTIEPDAAPGPYETEAEKLAASGIARAVIGAGEPDRSRSGRGVATLRQAGVDVRSIDHEPSRRLIEGFAMRARRGRPFVTAVLAVSADGMIAGSDGSSAGLLSQEARDWLAFRRTICDAMMTSARTMNSDEPRRLALLSNGTATERCIVVSGQGNQPLGLPSGTLRVRAGSDESPADGETIAVPAVNGRLDLRTALKAIGDRGISCMLVEAGARLTEALVAAELIDRFMLFDSMHLVGRGGIPATPLGAIDARLRAAGFELAEERLVGENRLRILERQP